MAKNTVSDWSTTASDNTDVGGISISGNAPPSNIDNGVREIMAQLALYIGTPSLAQSSLSVDVARTFSTKSANYTALAADKNVNLRFDGAYTLSLTAAATLGSGWYCFVQADGGAVVIDPNGSETINGAATITIPNGFSTVIWCDGSNFLAHEDYSATAALFAGRNLIINGQGRVNQRGYSSGSATSGANQYTLDRWRVVTSGQSLSFTGDNSRRTMTAPAGGVEQVIEGANIEGGTYVVNWTGTATCTIGGSSVSKGGTVTLTANTDATIKFSSGTFTDVQLEPGSVVTRFERLSYAEEIAKCQRYYYAWGGPQFTRLAVGYADSTTTAQFTFPIPVPMLSVNTANYANLTVNGITITALQARNVNGNLVSFEATVASGLTTGAVVQIYVASGTTGVVTISAEFL